METIWKPGRICSGAPSTRAVPLPGAVSVMSTPSVTPVLAGADLGVAMGGIGSDAAIEAADVVLMDDEIGKLAVGIKIAKNTRKVINQNIAFALGFKILVLILSIPGIATMWMAVFADVGVCVLAILNSMRKKD